MLLIVIVASVYVPCGIFIRDTGCIVPMRCVSSIVAAEDITETEALPEFVNVIELMVMANATSLSEGASPTLTCTVALFCAKGCELDPPPHEASRMISIRTVKSVKVKRHAFVLSTCRRILMASTPSRLGVRTSGDRASAGRYWQGCEVTICDRNHK